MNGRLNSRKVIDRSEAQCYSLLFLLKIQPCQRCESVVLPCQRCRKTRAPLPLLTCREGLVSREEITAYFMRASVICSKLGLGFVHNFQETTYMKPTFCDNCSGFVSSHTRTHTNTHACGRRCHIMKSGTLWLDHSSRLLHLQPACCFRSDRASPLPFPVCTLFHRSCGASSSKDTDAKVITTLLHVVQLSR